MKQCFLFFLMLGLWGCQEEKATLNHIAPALAVYQLDDTPVQLKDFQGKPLLINFWSKNCGVCIVELRELAKFSRQYPEHLQVLAISIDEKSDQLEALIEEENYPFTVGLDQLKITGERYQVIGTPTSFYIDAQSQLKAKHESLLNEEQLNAYFQGKNDE